jgi:putative ABC transport system permease protein
VRALLRAEAIHREIDEEMRFHIDMRADAQEPGSHYLDVVARLKDGVSLEQAQAEMEGIAARLEQQYPVNTGRGANIFPLHDEVVGAVRPALLLGPGPRQVDA